MIRVGKLFDKKKPILYAGLLLLALALISRIGGESWIEHGYLFSDFFLQAVFELFGALVFLFGIILLFYFAVCRKWPKRFLVLMMIPLLAVLVSLVSSSFLMGRKPLSNNSVVSQSAQLDDGAKVVLLPGPKNDVAGLDACPMLRLEREVPGGKIREYKTLIILPQHMVAQFELVEEGRKVRLIAPASSIFREIVVDFDSAWSANANKPTLRFDF